MFAMEKLFTNSRIQVFGTDYFGRISFRLYDILSKDSFLVLSDERVTISAYLFKVSDWRRIGFFIQVCLLYALITLST